MSSIARYGRYRTPDASGNENDGFLKAAAAITDGGRFDRGLTLDGTDDYVEIPDDDTLDITGGFTFEAWIKPTSAGLSGERVILAKWKTNGNKRSYRLYLDAGVPELQLSSNGSTVYTLEGTKAVLADEWTHVAATRSGSTVKILVNSAEEASGTYGSSLNGLRGTQYSITERDRREGNR